jgi:hypothetical protein
VSPCSTPALAAARRRSARHRSAEPGGAERTGSARRDPRCAAPTSRAPQRACAPELARRVSSARRRPRHHHVPAFRAVRGDEPRLSIGRAAPLARTRIPSRGCRRMPCASRACDLLTALRQVP